MIRVDERRRLGATGVELTALGLGAAPIGNLFAAVSAEEAAAVIDAALQHGVRWIDTAPLYGFGLSEQRVGDGLAKAAATRVAVSTKAGRRLEPGGDRASPQWFVDPLPFQPVFDYSAEGIRRSLLESLARLRRQSVDLLLLHDVDRLTHGGSHRSIVRQVIDQAVPEMHRLKSEGLVRSIGLGINQWEIGYELLLAAPLDAVLLAGRYSLLDQSAFTSGFLDACERLGVAVLAGGAFNSGLLAGGETYDYTAAPAQLRSRVAAIAAICGQWSVAMPAVALQFTAAHSAVRSVVVGARSRREVDEVVGWCQTPLPEGVWTEMQAQGLLPPDVPLPRSVP